MHTGVTYGTNRQRKERRQRDAESRKSIYATLTLDEKIQQQIMGGHDGKQLKKLRAQRDAT